ncbi:Serine/threonine-protein kinase PrkC [Stieleria neptunia]|uniref:Serine/threonine-protein kinase PrkC n=1 Tax=Stieleria neptunia TaxID=2527979 RepID=A0A518I1W0_9BACT|nr:WD40 repeat domain-containing serine/threonine protein kinase [Stieleria neptunia]QDV47071.1 Serine/threonine-protein kinase PrkC [Stieleria neptunia]
MAVHERGICPPHEILIRFLQGEVDETLLSDVSEHLESCRRCVDLLQENEAGLPIAQVTTDCFSDTLSETELQFLSRDFWKPAVPERIGKYPIKRELAVGGMGVVYEAWHPNLMCDVVIKTIKPDRRMRLDARQRMLAEQQLMGRLRHRSIVAVLDAGVDRDLPFIVMEKLPGVTLTRWVRDQSAPAEGQSIRPGIPWRDACRIGQAIAEGLAVLHRSGLIHRDVKPGNVMIDGDQKIKLLDLGLALDVGENGLSAAGESVGTPHYISPEQRQARETDRRTDLFGLAATIVFMLSGAPPEPDAPMITCDHLGKPLPDELRSLLSQMLHEDPGHRPDSAEQVAARLAMIKPRSSHRWQIPLAVTIGIVSVVLTTVALRWESPDAASIKTARDTPTRSRLFERPGLQASGLLPTGASTKLDTRLPRPVVVNAKLSRDGRYLACFGTGGNLRIYDVRSSEPNLVQLVRCYESTNVNHPQINWMDQDRVIAVTGSAFDRVLFWDVHQQQFRAETRPFTDALAGHVNASGDRLVVCDTDGRIGVYDADGQVVQEWSLPQDLKATSVSWSGQTSDLLIATTATKLVHYTDELSHTRIIDRSTSTTCILSLPQGQWCFGDPHGKVHHVDRDFETIAVHSIADRPIHSIVMGDQPTQIVVSADQVKRLDLQTGRYVTIPDNRNHRSPVLLQRSSAGVLFAGGDVRFSPFLSADQPSTLLTGTEQILTDIDISPQSDHLAFCSTVGITVADTQGKIRFRQRGDKGGFQELQWSPDGNRLAAVAGWGGRRLSIWSFDSADADTLHLRHAIDAPNSVTTLAWLNEQTLITVGEAGVARHWDIGSGTISASHDVGGFVRTLAVSPDRNHVAMGLQDGTLRIADPTLTTLATVVSPRDVSADGVSADGVSADGGGAIRKVRWHPTENQIAVVDEQRHIKIVDVDSGSELAGMHSPWVKPLSLCWAGDGQELAVTPLGIFGIGATGEFSQRRQLRRGTCVDWSADGDMLAFGESLSAVHFYRAGQHHWSIVLDQIDSAITLDANGNVISRWGSTDDLIR